MKQRPKPAYKRLSEVLRSRITDGAFDHREPLPPEVSIASEFNLSRHTVRQAFQDLVSEGLVYRVPRRGTFVTELAQRGRHMRAVGTIEEIMAWAGTTMEILQPLEIRADKEAAERLNLPSAEVGLLTTLRLNDGVAFAVNHIYLSPETAERLQAESLPEEGDGTVVGQLEPFIPRPIVAASQDIWAIPAPANIAKSIGGKPDEPTLHIHRMFFDSDDEPVELAVSYYNPKLYSYSIRLRRTAS